MIACPHCRSLSTIPISYGKPGPELERAASRGLVELGGCVVDNNNPTRRCLDCHYGWQDSRYVDAVSFISDAVVTVQKHRDSLSYHLTEYGAACIEYGGLVRRRDEAQHQAYHRMLSTYQAMDREWERFFVRAQEYCNHYAGSVNTRTYGCFPG